MSTSLLELLPEEIKQKIFFSLSNRDRIKLYILPGYRNLVCNNVNWERLDLDLLEDIPLELIHVFKEVALKVNYLTWQIGHVWNFRKLSQTVARFRNLVELDVSGNPQIKDIRFLVNLQQLRAISFRCCFKLSSLSLLHVAPQLKNLTWLDVAHCSQLREWHIDQLVRDTKSLKKLNVCRTVYFTLREISKIEAACKHLAELRFCAFVRLHESDIWNRIVSPDYIGPLKLCEAMFEILSELN